MKQKQIQRTKRARPTPAGPTPDEHRAEIAAARKAAAEVEP